MKIPLALAILFCSCNPKTESNSSGNRQEIACNDTLYAQYYEVLNYTKFGKKQLDVLYRSMAKNPLNTIKRSEQRMNKDSIIQYSFWYEGKMQKATLKCYKNITCDFIYKNNTYKLIYNDYLGSIRTMIKKDKQDVVFVIERSYTPKTNASLTYTLLDKQLHLISSFQIKGINEIKEEAFQDYDGDGAIDYMEPKEIGGKRMNHFYHIKQGKSVEFEHFPYSNSYIYFVDYYHPVLKFRF